MPSVALRMTLLFERLTGHAAPLGVQLLLACVALLNSSVVRVVELAMHLLLQVRVFGVQSENPRVVWCAV